MSASKLVEGETAFLFPVAGGEEQKVNVKFETGRSSDADLWTSVHDCEKFQNWLKLYEKSSSMELKGVTIRSVERNGEAIEGIKLEADVHDKHGRKVPGDVYLRGPKTAVLILLRNTENNKDMCLFVQQPRASLGQSNFMEIPEGHLTEDGEFSGPAAEKIAQILDIRVKRSDAVSLTGLAFSAKTEGVWFAPEVGDERVQLYLYRKNLSAEETTRLEVKVNGRSRGGGKSSSTTTASVVSDLRNGDVTTETGEKEKEKDEDEKTLDKKEDVEEEKMKDEKERQDIGGVQLRLIPLGDAWRQTTDAKSMASLFLVHELRYHGLMPRYRAPRESLGGKRNGRSEREIELLEKKSGHFVRGEREIEPLEKKSAHFVKIGDLDPTSSGVNLRVKVFKCVELDVDRQPRKDGRKVRSAHMVVGDEEGIITLKLVDDQVDIPHDLGTPMVIRNGKVDMDDGHMKLAVDRWGKITTEISTQEVSTDFNFDVSDENDVSSTEYELVVLPENEHVGGGDHLANRDGISSQPKGRGRRNRAGRGGSGGRKWAGGRGGNGGGGNTGSFEGGGGAVGGGVNRRQ